jgi:ADP-heptose:LPS heptosyltransferase
VTVVCSHVTAPLFRNSPRVDAIIETAAADLSGFGGKWRLAAALRRNRYDLALCCNAGAAWPVVLAWGAIPRRIGLLPNFAGRTTRLAARLWTLAVPHRGGRLVMETYFDMLQAVAPIQRNLGKEVFASADAIAEAQQLLPDTGRYIGVAVSSGNKLKELGAPKLRAVVTRLLSVQGDARVVLLGTAGDAAAAAAIAADLPPRLQERLIDGTGRFRLEQLPAVLKRLSLLVGVDSGLSYMADALGIPLVSVAGPADMADARPLGEHAIVIRRDLPCAPCSHYFQAPYACRTGTRACIEEVGADEIVAAALALLNRSPS